MTKRLSLLLAFCLGLWAYVQAQQNNPPIYIAFLWHMHQPIYYPGETCVTTHQLNRYI